MNQKSSLANEAEKDLSAKSKRTMTLIVCLFALFINGAAYAGSELQSEHQSVLNAELQLEASAGQSSEKIQLPHTTNKIIALAPNIVEILFALGVGSEIVGVSEHTDYPSAAKNIPTVANYLGVQLETVVQINPTLVIVWQGGTPQKDIDKLRSLNINVHEFSANSIPELIDQIERLGGLVSKPEQAKLLISQIKTDYDTLLSAQSARRALGLSGFVEIWPEPLTTAGGQTIIGQAMNYCGLSNIFESAKNSYPQVSLEKVIVAAPDIIIQPVSKSNPTVTKEWHRYTMIPAAKNKAIVSPDSDALFRWGPRLPAEIQKMCKQIQNVINVK